MNTYSTDLGQRTGNRWGLFAICEAVIGYNPQSSLPGAFIGGLILGVVEALGAGCVPDPQRAASYIPAYGMIILTLVLLLKPTGLFGREL